MQHRGEIVKNAIKQSGYSITKLAEKLGRSRRWVYQMFENSNVSLDLILRIGEIIHFDFTDEVKELKKRNFTSQEPRDNSYQPITETVDYWKDKYLQLLEEYNALLKKK